ncbi:hypothetical protein ACFVXQ_00150 [Kitasatospora sp. NPDC058263]
MSIDPYGLADALPEGYTPIGIVASIKALNEAGDIVILNYRQPGLPSWEALGMLVSATDDVRAGLQRTEEN